MPKQRNFKYSKKKIIFKEIVLRKNPNFFFNISKNISVQSSASEIIKMSLFYIYYRLLIEIPDSFIINTIHDEVLVYSSLMSKYNVSYIVINEMGYACFRLFPAVKSFVKAHINYYWQ